MTHNTMLCNEEMNWKSIIILVVVALGTFILGFMIGETKQAKVSAKSHILFDSMALSAIEAGQTNHAAYCLESVLIGSLNMLDTLDRNRFLFYATPHSWTGGPRWDAQLKWAQERTKQKRDEMRDYAQHPDKLKRKLEGILNQGNTNVPIEVKM